MLHKLFLSAVVLLTAATVYAQKPIKSAVTDIEDNPANGLEMCRSLFNEYFLSDLTTHVKVTMLDTATVQKAILKLKYKRGTALSDKQIQALCKELKLDAICLVSLARPGKNMVVTIKIKQNTGKQLGVVSAQIESISDTDTISTKLAAECAVIMRALRGIQ